MEKFVSQQKIYHSVAVKELSQGKKQSHWMWFIFPQIKGLGSSYYATYYALNDAQEVERYWQNEYLKNNYLELCNILLNLPETNVTNIFEFPDDLKLKSSLTLFYLVTQNEIVKKTLEKFFGSSLDAFTVNSLRIKS